RSGMDEYYSPRRGAGSGRARAGRRAAGRRTSRKSRAGAGKGRASSSPRTGSRRASGERTKAELYAEARRFGIEGRSKMSKAELARAVGRRRGRSSGSGRAKANPVSVQAFLEGVGYPTRKRQLLREAESQGAGREVRATLKRLPDKNFDSPTEVS